MSIFAATFSLIAVALHPAMLPHLRARAAPLRLGVGPVLELGDKEMPLRRANSMKKKAERQIFIDGNNLMMQRKVTKGREALAMRLAGIGGASVVVVFDGRVGAPRTRPSGDLLSCTANQQSLPCRSAQPPPPSTICRRGLQREWARPEGGDH